MTADETAEHPPREILWDKYNRQVAHTSRTPPHIVLRDDGKVLQQIAGDSCVFVAIAHGFPQRLTAKTLRDEVIQFLEAGTNQHIGGDTVENWIQPVQGHHGNQSTVAEYTHALKEEGLGGDFEIAIIAELQQIQIAIYIEHDLGYEREATHGSAPNEHTANILRTGSNQYVALTVTGQKAKGLSHESFWDGKLNPHFKTGKERDDRNCREERGAVSLPTLGGEHSNEPSCSSKDPQHIHEGSTENEAPTSTKDERHTSTNEERQDKRVIPEQHNSQVDNQTTWFKVVGVVPLPWFEMRRLSIIFDVIMIATPNFLHDAANEGPSCHLRITNGAPQGWLEYENESTLNQAERIVLERNIRDPVGPSLDPDFGEKDIQRDPDTLAHAPRPQGQAAHAANQDANSGQELGTSTTGI